MKSGLELTPSPNIKKREGQCFLQIHSALVCLCKHPEELRVRSSEPGSASGLLLLLPTCCVRRQEGSKHVGGGITGTATGLSQAAGASKFLLTSFPQTLILWKQQSQICGLSPPLLWSIYPFRGRKCAVCGALEPHARAAMTAPCASQSARPCRWRSCSSVGCPGTPRSVPPGSHG